MVTNIVQKKPSLIGQRKLSISVLTKDSRVIFANILTCRIYLLKRTELPRTCTIRLGQTYYWRFEHALY